MYLWDKTSCKGNERKGMRILIQIGRGGNMGRGRHMEMGNMKCEKRKERRKIGRGEGIRQMGMGKRKG